MAIAHPYVKKEWEEWKREMKENRSRRWGERMSHWAEVEMSDDEEEEEGEEEPEDVQEEELEDIASEEKEVSSEKEEEETQAGGATGVGKDVVEEEEENKVEKDVMEAEELQEGLKEQDEREGGENIQGGEKEGSGGEEVEEEEEEEHHMLDAGGAEEEPVEEGDEIVREGKNKIRENEAGTSNMREAEEMVEEQDEEESQRNIKLENHVDWDKVGQADEQKDDDGGDDDDDEEEEEYQEQEHTKRTEEENINGSQGRAEEQDFADSMESDPDLTDEEEAAKKQQHEGDPNERFWGNESSNLGLWTSEQRMEEEDEREKLTYAAETVTELREDDKDIDEDESTDDEDAENSADDDEDEDVKIYCKTGYCALTFSTLAEFKDSRLLTDLMMNTEDGRSFHVHSTVMAAVSSLIWKHLSRSKEENRGVNLREDGGTSEQVVSLGPEVTGVGLEAVVEFAYTGLISHLNDIVHYVKAAAQTLGIPRVLDLCAEEEEMSSKTGGPRKENRLSAAEQLTVTLRSIKQQWMDGVGCDVVLKALRGSFHVHRVILAAWSDYFRIMFTSGMKESRQPRVTLRFILASELKVLIDCSYSGTLPLSWSCVFEITSIALQLQYQPALSLCLNFLHQEINPDSCLDVASFAGAYEMGHLLEVADDFVLRQFQKVACTSKFKDLPAKQLLRYLNSKSLCVPSELVVFKAVVAWIQAKPEKRLRFAKELMKTVHFHLMTFKEFNEVLSLKMWTDQSMAEVYEAVFEDFCSSETTLQSQCRIYLPKESLVLIGGDQTFENQGNRSISKDLWFGNSLRNHIGIKKAMEWRKLGEMPEPARFSHEVTVLRGQLYVFGGKKYYGTDDTLNSVYRYDPLQNSWESLAEMQEKRCSFSVVVLDDKIYAIGGYCDSDHIESVEQYCPMTNSWSFAWPLDLPLSAHVAKVLHGQIFISGGLSNDYRCLASMFVYAPQTGSTYLANMAKPRAHHCMETLGERFYVAGGVTTDHDVMSVDQLACEVYDPALDSWTAFMPLPVPHVGAGGVVLEDKFYVLGGYSQEDYSDTKLVHRYDPATQRWENIGKMPGPNNDIRASLLCLPPHFRL